MIKRRFERVTVNQVPAKDEGEKEENNSSRSIRIEDEDKVAHSFASG